jgi:formylglycine-generating enzyme required for sulfatase activity
LTAQLGQVGTSSIPVVALLNAGKVLLFGKTEVTQSQYQAITKTTPSRFKGDNLPVEQVSWYDAVKFCNQLSVQDGLTPVYNDNNEADLTANGWRLPTEAEWELAAKGGNSGNNYTYSGSNNIDKVAWYLNNSDDKTQPVASKKPNELGLFDLSGNVWEWCNDVVSGSYRVYRGGSWNNNAGSVRISYRDNYRDYGSPGSRYGNFGFRVVRSQSTK